MLITIDGVYGIRILLIRSIGRALNGYGSFDFYYINIVLEVLFYSL